MADKLHEKLVDYLQDAHAMEQNVLRMLDSMISTTDDEEIRGMLEHHRGETERHEERLRGRLDALDEGSSKMKQAAMVGGAMMKGMTDQMRGDKAGKNARDGYVTEHMEIAAYELLERLAKRAGDQDTAHVAQLNCADERKMAEKIEEHWDRFLDLSLQEAGV